MAANEEKPRMGQLVRTSRIPWGRYEVVSAYHNGELLRSTIGLSIAENTTHINLPSQS
jgi:hypothetical protein